MGWFQHERLPPSYNSKLSLSSQSRALTRLPPPLTVDAKIFCIAVRGREVSPAASPRAFLMASSATRDNPIREPQFVPIITGVVIEKAGMHLSTIHNTPYTLSNCHCIDALVDSTKSLTFQNIPVHRGCEFIRSIRIHIRIHAST